MTIEPTDTGRGIHPAQLYQWSGLALVAAFPLQVTGFLLHPPANR